MTSDRREGFDCVVDASVGIKLFLVEPLSDRSLVTADKAWVHCSAYAGLDVRFIGDWPEQSTI
jgi:hypothetical protein